MAEKEVKLMKGNEVIAHAAIRYGCDGYFGLTFQTRNICRKAANLSRDVHTLRKNAARKNRDFSRSKKAISADAGSAKADSSKQIT